MIRLPHASLAKAQWIDPSVREKLLNSPYTTKSGDVLVHSELSRSQRANLEDCFEKLAKELERLAFVPREPSPEAARRQVLIRHKAEAQRKEQKKRQSMKKQDRK